MSVPSWWLVVAVGFVVIEVLPPATHLACLGLAVGALAASVASAFFPYHWLPWVVFIVVSGALMPIFIPLAKFLFASKGAPVTSQPAVGERAQVVEAIDGAAPGIVKLRGEEWSAKSDGEAFAKDEWVQVSAVEGNQVIVRRSDAS